VPHGTVATMNRYPLWKNLLIVFVLLIGLLYALPNLYPQDPVVEVSGTRGATVTQALGCGSASRVPRTSFAART